MNTSQFDNVHGIAARQSTNPNAVKKIDAVVADQLSLLSKMESRPPNIGFFEEALVRPGKNVPDLPKVGVYCNMIPYELISAFGARPIRLGCGNPAAVPVGEEIISGDVCPVVKGSIGMLLCQGSIASECKAFILPTSCDAKKKMGEILSDYKPVFMLNLPPEQNSNLFLSQTATEIERLACFLKKTLGKSLDRKKLISEINLSNRRTSILRKMHSLRISHPLLLSMRDLFIIIQSGFTGIPLDIWVPELEKTLSWLEKEAGTAPAHRNRTGIILTGSPIIWPNFKVLTVIEESGIDILSDTLCTGIQSCYDPAICDETSLNYLYRGLSMKYIYASICPCFISQTTKLNRILELVKETSSKGVINHALRLCQLCDLENYRLRQIMKTHAVPLLDLRTDYSFEDTEQLRIRVEAFLETIE